jgi:hypothetical protein
MIFSATANQSLVFLSAIANQSLVFPLKQWFLLRRRRTTTMVLFHWRVMEGKTKKNWGKEMKEEEL